MKVKMEIKAPIWFPKLVPNHEFSKETRLVKRLLWVHQNVKLPLVLKGVEPDTRETSKSQPAIK